MIAWLVLLAFLAAAQAAAADTAEKILELPPVTLVGEDTLYLPAPPPRGVG